jgi:phosphatidylinositol alpha 1,6-mannosyltransferase
MWMRRNDPVRIAISAESFLPRTNGVANSVAHVARSLRHMGHQCLIIAPDTFPNCDFEGIPVHRVRSVQIPGLHEVDVALTSTARLSAELEAFAPDVVHLASPFVLGRQVLAAARACRIPAVAVYQTHIAGFAQHYGLSGVSFLADSVVRAVHRSADLTLAPSRQCVDYLAGLGVQRIRLWGRGVDMGRFSPARRSRALREHWSPDGRPVVGFVGRLAPEKGVHTLAGLAASGDVRVVIVGDGPMRGDLGRLMPQARFTNRLLDHELSTAVASMDVLVAPGELETFCQVVQEAMASGVPVVAPAVGGPLDLVEHGVTGLLYSPGDRRGMEALVRQVAFDEVLAARLRRGGLEQVASRSWLAVTQELMQHYCDVTGRVLTPAA